MRKVHLITAIAISSIVMVGPLVIGQRIKQVYPQALTQKANTQGLEFELVDYKRGYFKSRAHLIMKVPNSNPRQPKHLVKIEQKIYHGPILFSRLGKHFDLNFNPAVVHSRIEGEFGQQLKQLWHGLDPAMITTLIDWRGKMTTKIKLNPISQQFPKQLIEISRASLQFSHDRYLNNLYGKLVLPRLHLKDTQDLTLEAVDVHWKGNLHSLFDLEDAKIDIGYVDLKENNQQVLNIQRLMLKLEKDQTYQDKVDFKLAGTIGHGRIYGDEYPFSEGTIQIANLSNRFIHEIKGIPANANLNVITPQILALLSQSGARVQINIPKKIAAGMTTLYTYKAFQRHGQEAIGDNPTHLKAMFQHQTMAFLSKLVETNTIQETVHSYQFDLAFKPENKIKLNGRLMDNPLYVSRNDETGLPPRKE